MSALPGTLQKMVESRQLERVPPNPTHAQSLLQAARRHLRTARLLQGEDDDAMAFTAAYDAARKALVAVLAVRGLRVRNAGGAHRATGVAAAALLGGSGLVTVDFDWMRQVRNSTEYPDHDHPTASAQDVAEAIGAAADIVALCEESVGRGPT